MSSTTTTTITATRTTTINTNTINNNTINSTPIDSIDNDSSVLPILRPMRLWLLNRVLNEITLVAAFQRLCGLKLLDKPASASVAHYSPNNSNKPQSNGLIQRKTAAKSGVTAKLIDTISGTVDSAPIQSYSYSNPFLYYYFTAAAGLGNELFYIIFLPALFWLFNVLIARRLILLWMATYYVGQLVKDLFQLPRPNQAGNNNSGIIELETHYNTEYGFPSTHSMIGLTLPAYLFYLINYIQYTNSINTYYYLFGLIIVFIWTISVTLSRLHHGVHSITDIIGGLLLGLLVLFNSIYYTNIFDQLVLYNRYSPIILLFSSIILSLLYPKPAKWTSAYGDTVLSIGVWFGVNLASNTHYFKQFTAVDYYSILSQNDSISTLIMIVALRLVLGLICMVITRAIIKSTLLAILTRLILTESQQQDPSINPLRIYSIEIPIKFFTYAAVGFNATYGFPALCHYCGI